MTVQELCKRIGLQESIAMKVNEFIAAYDFTAIDDTLKKLITPQTAEAAYQKLNEIFAEDEDKIKMLACHLLCAARLYDQYLDKGISEQIYTETMKCFTRFIGECYIKTGKYAFDRAWWTYRQVSMVLFRIGELEYELLEQRGTKFVSVHIPSDAKMTDEKLDKSLYEADEFLRKFYPEFADCDYICDSWLLSLKLRELLREDSNIIRFQNRFEITEQTKNDRDFIEWLYQMPVDTEISKLREDTSLQRKVKKLLEDGDNIGSGYGIMKNRRNLFCNK